MPHLIAGGRRLEFAWHGPGPQDAPTLVFLHDGLGDGDEYGTLRQVEVIERQLGGTVERVVLADCGHTPHRDQAERTLGAIARFLREHGLVR